VSDNELGIFLRSRREAVVPAAAGLPAGSRRRTPGLRRSEVAALAGVSVEYVTRLEQGRDRRPSASVLGALAGALGLTGAERVHLHRLAKGAEPGFTCTGGAAPTRSIRPTVRALLDRLGPSPAVVVNQLGDALAWTEGYARLAGPVGLLDGDPPNLLRYVFTDRRARTVYPDWERIADDRVAALKEGGLRADPFTTALTDELTVTAGQDFERRLSRVPGLAAATGVLRMRVPEHGELRLAYETLDLAADIDLRLIVHLPADAATAEALEQRAPVLRLVSG
jgi:transcriptional regulator with XRE-family HTH domain